VAGHCSLRDAITSANLDGPVHGCAAGTGDDTIVFANGVSGTIILNAVLPDIDRNLSIVGPSAGIVISGNNQVPIMFIDEASLGRSTVILRNLTFTAARYNLGGGAINNNGTLTVDNCTFSENEGNNGGAIISIGRLTVSNSTFSSNNALVGGALGLTRSQAGDTTVVVNSTFYGNSAGQGGAIFVGGARLNVVNSTFSDNGASIGGGIFSTLGITTAKGTIVTGSAGDNCDGDIEDEGYNISDDATCHFSAAGSHNNTDPQLDPGGLADNGGPTQTIALLAGSPAIDKIPPEICPATDQREYLRPAPGQTDCDIGSFELNAVPAPTIDCSAAKASRPNLVSLPLAFMPESIFGVTDPGGRSPSA